MRRFSVDGVARSASSKRPRSAWPRSLQPGGFTRWPGPVKRENGKVKIVRKHERPTRKGGWRGAGIGLATGAVIALFPAAAIGSGLLAATTGGGAALGALAGHAAGGMSRSDLKDLGEHLDAGQTGLVVVAAANVSGKVEAALQRASNVMTKLLDADEAAIDEDVKEAESEGS